MCSPFRIWFWYKFLFQAYCCRIQTKQQCFLKILFAVCWPLFQLVQLLLPSTFWENKLFNKNIKDINIRKWFHFRWIADVQLGAWLQSYAEMKGRLFYSNETIYIFIKHVCIFLKFLSKVKVCKLEFSFKCYVNRLVNKKVIISKQIGGLFLNFSNWKRVTTLISMRISFYNLA